MQKFQNIGTRTKVAIATVALVGIIGAGIVVAPTIIGNEKPASITPTVMHQDTLDPTATSPAFTRQITPLPPTVTVPAGVTPIIVCGHPGHCSMILPPSPETGEGTPQP